MGVWGARVMAEQDRVRIGGDAAVPSLAELVAPMSVRDFLAQHWNRGFRAWPGQAGRFAGLVGWDEIN
ncbi:MAG TPA: hypothetical protein PKD48_05400, partial [Sphingopyxis sp.]|nr:hypothetical protein [Sphingopyxis sp.]